MSSSLTINEHGHLETGVMFQIDQDRGGDEDLVRLHHTNDAGLVLGRGEEESGGVASLESRWDGSSNYLHIGIRSADERDTFGANRILTIKDSGTVGIGTVEPDYPLHVEGHVVGGWAAKIHSGPTSVFVAAEYGFAMLINTGVENASERYGLKIENSSETHLLVRDDGWIGIGTDQPAGKLDIKVDQDKNGTTSTDDAGRARLVLHNDASIQFADQDGTGRRILEYDNSHRTFLNGQSGTGITIYPSGNVGVGTSGIAGPEVKLEVNSTIKASGLDLDGRFELPGDLSIDASVLPDARSAPPDADLETLVIDKNSGKIYMQ